MVNPQPAPLDITVIERDIKRGTRYFHGVTTVPAIANVLAGRGYTDAEHQQGLGYLAKMLGFRSPSPVMVPTSSIYARGKLDEWDGPNIAIARAALTHRFPDQATYVVGDLTNQAGYEAVLNVITFLERVTALRDGTDPNRAGTRDADKAAVALLGQRNVFTPTIEAELRGLVAEATATAPQSPQVEVIGIDDYNQATLAFHEWLADWRETARAVITRRDYLIRLGLAQRRSSKAMVEDVDDEDIETIE